VSILGVVLRAAPKHRYAVNARLSGLPGVDVVSDPGDGRWVVVIEDTGEPQDPTAAATLGAMATWPELLGTSLVYEYSGPDAPAPGQAPPNYRAWRDSLAHS
jgi:nitrate reductase NapAB chaperone NapD